MKKLLRKSIQKIKFNQWFSNRMPVGDSINLNQSSTYILPTKAGFLMMLIIVLMMIASTNYQNNLAFLLTFLITGIGIVSTVFTFKNLQGLCFELQNTFPVFAGDLLSLKIKVSSQNKSPHSGIGVGLEKKSLYYFDVPGSVEGRAGLNILIVPVKTKSRGWFSIPKVYSTSCFPFGLLKVWSWFKFKSSVLVYPQAIEPDKQAFKQKTNEPGDDSKSDLKVDDLEFDGIKAYKQGEPMSRVDWKSTAKEQGMYVKNFESLIVNEHAFSWDDFNNIDDELRISYLCFLVVNANKKQQAFSLTLPGRHIKKNLGESHLQKCLTALALYKIK